MVATDALMVAAVFTSVALLTGGAASAALRHYAPERKRLRDMVRMPGCATSPMTP